MSYAINPYLFPRLLRVVVLRGEYLLHARRAVRVLDGDRGCAHRDCDPRRLAPPRNGAAVAGRKPCPARRRAPRGVY